MTLQGCVHGPGDPRRCALCEVGADTRTRAALAKIADASRESDTALPDAERAELIAWCEAHVRQRRDVSWRTVVSAEDVLVANNFERIAALLRGQQQVGGSTAGTPSSPGIPEVAAIQQGYHYVVPERTSDDTAAQVLRAARLLAEAGPQHGLDEAWRRAGVVAQAIKAHDAAVARYAGDAVRGTPSSDTALTENAARWRWVRDHGMLTVDEDDGLWLGVFLCGDFSERGSAPYLTRHQRAVLLGDKLGRRPFGEAVLTKAVDAKRAPVGKPVVEPSGSLSDLPKDATT